MKKFLVMAVGLVFIASCSSKQELYLGQQKLSTGLNLYQKGDYKKAKEELKAAIFKSQDLTPAQLMEARFALADSYYNREEYVDAIVEFEEFISLFPTSPKIPEVLYKLAMSYLLVSPDYKRDLTYVQKAQEKAEEIISSYPDSKYVKSAQEIVKKANEIKAKHTLYIAETYEKYGKPYSASLYYKEAYSKYKDYINKDYVVYKLAYNLTNVEKQYDKDIQDLKDKIKELDKEIQQTQNLEEKNILINRKNILTQELDTYLDRIKQSKEEAKKLLEAYPKAFPESKYLKETEDLEKENMIQKFIKKIFN